jgi:hypothetical protein
VFRKRQDPGQSRPRPCSASASLAESRAVSAGGPRFQRGTVPVLDRSHVKGAGRPASVIPRAIEEPRPSCRSSSRTVLAQVALNLRRGVGCTKGASCSKDRASFRGPPRPALSVPKRNRMGSGSSYCAWGRGPLSLEGEGRGEGVVGGWPMSHLSGLGPCGRSIGRTPKGRPTRPDAADPTKDPLPLGEGCGERRVGRRPQPAPRPHGEGTSAKHPWLHLGDWGSST